MSRSVAYRRTVSDAVSWRQDQSLQSVIYILRETGPTGFLLKEEGEIKKYRVFLGDPHTCTCPVYTKEKDLCKHICWVLLKKFRVDRQNPVSFQLGLVEREINEILRGQHREEQERRNAARRASQKTGGAGGVQQADGKSSLSQKEITEEDICPICQEELLGKRDPVTYCRYGCGKSIHIKCMKVWADHQASTGEKVIKCPLCREDFGPLQALQQEYRTSSIRKTRSERLDTHPGFSCVRCHAMPIQGKCYKCVSCVAFCLCQACFSDNVHQQHSFQFRQKASQRWRPATRGSGSILPSAIISHLQNRDISAGDYDLLMLLDSQEAAQATTVPEEVVRSLPTQTVRQGGRLLAPGAQCRMCLREYVLGQTIRRLPCKHEFHQRCIDPWLINQHSTCPVDGQPVYDPAAGAIVGATSSDSPARRKPPAGSSAHQEGGRDQAGGNLQLEIPGIGYARRGGSNGSQQAAAARSRNSGGGQVLQLDVANGLTASFELMGAGILTNSRTPPSNHQQNSQIRTQPVPSSEHTTTSSPLLRAGRLQQDPLLPQSTTTNPNPLEAEPVRRANSLRNINVTPPRPRRHPPLSAGSLIDRPGPASIPLPREVAMTPVHGQSNSAPNPANRKPPLPEGSTGKKTGSVLVKSQKPYRARSSSASRYRSSSEDRKSKMEVLENLFLGSRDTQESNGSKSQGSRARGRARSQPSANGTCHNQNGEMALAGNALLNLALHDLEATTTVAANF